MAVSTRSGRLFLLLTLLIFCPLALSEIYSWVDENGKKHFGDKIPPEYQDQASEYAVPRTNSSRAVEVDTRKAPQPATQMPWADNDREAIERSHNQPLRAMPENEPGTCEEKRAAYLQSKMCFDVCRKKTGNVGNCSHCKPMKNPGFC
jgi:hypothetical protein